jgi:hypothetical protein
MIPFDLTLSALQKSPDPTGDIIRSSAYWAPLQLLYVELVKNKDLIRITDLTKEKKLQLLDKVKYQQWPQWKKINVIQAIYVYESLIDY